MQRPHIKSISEVVSDTEHERHSSDMSPTPALFPNYHRNKKESEILPRFLTRVDLKCSHLQTDQLIWKLKKCIRSTMLVPCKLQIWSSSVDLTLSTQHWDKSTTSAPPKNSRELSDCVEIWYAGAWACRGCGIVEFVGWCVSTGLVITAKNDWYDVGRPSSDRASQYSHLFSFSTPVFSFQFIGTLHQ